MRLGVVECTQSEGRGCEKCIFSRVNDFFRNFCRHGLPFRLAKTRGHIVQRVERSVKYNGRVGHLLRKSINDNGALITLVYVLVTLSGKFRTYVVTPARVLTRRRCAAFRRVLFNLPIEIRLLANAIRKGHHGRILRKLRHKRIGVLINARTMLRSTIAFESLNVIIVSRRRHFKITRHTHL